MIDQLTRADQTRAAIPLSVIVCSHGRPSLLDSCLGGIIATDPADLDLIVVDTSTDWQAAETIAARHGARFLREPAPSIDAARNRGVTEARHDVIAFTVDRARPDSNWIPAMARAFCAPDVMAVSGLVAPSELETLAQSQVHNWFGPTDRTAPRIFRTSQMRTFDLLWARHMGSGANMAFRRSVLLELGAFDVGLSAPRGDEGAGDSDMLTRLLNRGHLLVYRPDAVVSYTHDREIAAARSVVRAKAAAHGLRRVLLWRSGTIGARAFVGFAGGYLGGLCWRLLRPRKRSRSVVVAELLGTLRSPWGYVGRQRHAAAVDSPAVARKTPHLSSPRVPPAAAVVRTPGQEAMRVQIVRTSYAHWGRYSGINQFIRHLDPGRFSVREDLVPEREEEPRGKSSALRDWLGPRLPKKGMPWYSPFDLEAEMRTAFSYCGLTRLHLLHYLDGEHSGQFLPRWSRGWSHRPKTVATYHQPPDVLVNVIRADVVDAMDRITVVSPEQAEFFAGLVTSERVRLTPHGVDTDFFAPGPDRVNGNRFRCLTVGSNYRDFGAIRATAKLLQDDSAIEFHVVSHQPTGLEDLPNVKCSSGLSDAELLAAYQESSLLFIPLTKVTANNAVLEAMATGLPVLSTDLPAMGLYVNDQCSTLVARNVPGDFSDAIRFLSRNWQQALAMGRCARIRAEEFDWRRISASFADVYAGLA
jgi:glycosyltransferase involved in cell wall biosynthesis